VRHFDLHKKTSIETADWLPAGTTGSVDIGVTSGASCPDSTVEGVMRRLLQFFPNARPLEEAELFSQSISS
jgi:4-hydroxy-3-methylbut-2-enyl diphosphate reductase